MQKDLYWIEVNPLIGAKPPVSLSDWPSSEKRSSETEKEPKISFLNGCDQRWGWESPVGVGMVLSLLLILILLLGTLEQVPFWWAVTWCGGTLLGSEQCECLPHLGLMQAWPPCSQVACMWHGAGVLHPFPLQEGCSSVFAGDHVCHCLFALPPGTGGASAKV